MLIEPETIDLARVPNPLRRVLSGEGIIDLAEPGAEDFLDRLCNAHDRLVAGTGALRRDDEGFDRLVFGSKLPVRVLDARISRSLALLQQHGTAKLSAEQLAASVQLSFWRFLHLFKDEVGVPLRTFRSWKRARSLLHFVNSESNLARLAQETGYPDSTHLSHSIRQVYGLKPREILRKLPRPSEA